MFAASSHLRKPRGRAFTLIEILVVLVLVAILMALVVPAIGSGVNTKLSTTSREMVNYLGAARADAIARRTALRFGIVVSAPGNEEWEYRRYGLWEWDRETEEFLLKSELATLPEGILFESKWPGFADQYVTTAEYYQKDNYALDGTFFIDLAETNAKFQGSNGTPPQVYGDPVEVQYIEFRPNGSVRIDGTAKRHFSFILIPAFRDGANTIYTSKGGSGASDLRNWAQLNLDSYTGRVRLYRP